MQELPETQRTALLLREIDALSYEQIAEAMETTVPSVKSLLVRARVSLAEAAEARLLSCEEVRHELGEVAEGLRRTTAPVRRHLRTCERCATFRKQLRQTNKALAAIFPVAPLLLLKKSLLAHLGTSAAASSGTAAARAARPPRAPPPAARCRPASARSRARPSPASPPRRSSRPAPSRSSTSPQAARARRRRDGRRRAAAGRRQPSPLRPGAGAAALDGRRVQAQAPREAQEAGAPPPRSPPRSRSPAAKPGAADTEQHDSSTTELPSETTGSTQEGDGVIAPADRRRPPRRSRRRRRADALAAARADADARRPGADPHRRRRRRRPPHAGADAGPTPDPPDAETGPAAASPPQP